MNENKINEGKKILVVEDDNFISEVYALKIRSEGFEVELAFDGEMALKKFDEFKPDLVLLDIIIPKLDGWGVLAEIRKRNKTVPVVMLTNLGDKENIEKGGEAPVSDYLIKSFFTPEEIVARIKKVMKMK